MFAPLGLTTKGGTQEEANSTFDIFGEVEGSYVDTEVSDVSLIHEATIRVAISGHRVEGKPRQTRQETHRQVQPRLLH